MVLANTALSEEQKELLTHYIGSYKEADNKWPLYSDFDFFDGTTLLPVGEDDSPEEVIIMGNQQNNGKGHLIGTFQKWLKIFPFELGCFKHDKQYFLQRFSDFISKGSERTNRYLELSFRQTKTTSEFISFLIDTTKQILHDIDSTSWIESADPSNIKSRQLALIRHSHRIKQEKLLAEFNDGEKVYVKVLKEWLKNEKKFFEELSACIPDTDTKITPQVLGTVIELFPMDIVGKLHDHCNGQQFGVQSIDLYHILNQPDQWKNTVHIRKGEITRTKLLMYTLNEYLTQRDIPNEHIESVSAILSGNTNAVETAPVSELSEEEQERLDKATALFEWLQGMEKPLFDNVYAIMSVIHKQPAFAEHIVRSIKGKGNKNKE